MSTLTETNLSDSELLSKLPAKLVLIDGYCNFCHRTVKWIERYSNSKDFYYTNLQSDLGKRIIELFNIKNPDESVLFLENGKLSTHSTAILRIARHLGFPMNFLRVFLLIPSGLRDYIYKVCSRNRYRWFGKKEVCELPSIGFKERVIE